MKKIMKLFQIKFSLFYDFWFNYGKYGITKTIVIIALIIIFSILLIIFGMFIQKICFKDRKKRANELKDNFEYISDNTDENGLVINDEDKN